MTSGDEMTGTGQAMGTADYMAPEQASDSRNVDIRADIYSLGCTLYKLLSGRAPFSGPQYRGALDKMNAHVSQPVPPIRRLVPKVPDELAAILDRMLAKTPGARFATPAEVSKALEPFCAGANLADLAARASASSSSRTRDETGKSIEVAKDNEFGESNETGKSDEVGKSNELGGDNESPLSLWERARVRAPAPGRRSTTKTISIGLTLLGSLAAAFAAGVVITIQKDGQTYQLDVPANSRTTINEEGNATVGVSGKPGELSALVVRNLALVREVRGYGDFVPFEKTSFAPGQEVILYAEVENFESAETPKGFRTRFHGSYEISDVRGQRVAFQELGNTDDHCRNQRRDLSLNYLVRLPKQINDGRHTLKLTLEDLRGQKTGQSSLEFTIKAIGGAGGVARPERSDGRGEARERPATPFTKPQGVPPGRAPQMEVYRLERISPELALEVLQMLLAGAPDVRLTFDSKTGSIIAVARPNEHATIRAALERLERVAKGDAAKPSGKMRFHFRHQPWKDVLPWLAEQAGLSLDMDAPPEGTFNYTDDREYTPDEAIDLVNSVLRTKDHTLVRRGRQLVLIKLEGRVASVDLIPMIAVGDLDSRGAHEFVQVEFHLNKTEPKEAEAAIRPLLGPHGSVWLSPGTRDVRVIDIGSRVRQVRDLLNRMEAERSPTNNSVSGGTALRLSHATMLGAASAPASAARADLDAKAILPSLRDSAARQVEAMRTGQAEYKSLEKVWRRGSAEKRAAEPSIVAMQGTVRFDDERFRIDVEMRREPADAGPKASKACMISTKKWNAEWGGDDVIRLFDPSESGSFRADRVAPRWISRSVVLNPERVAVKLVSHEGHACYRIEEVVPTASVRQVQIVDRERDLILLQHETYYDNATRPEGGKLRDDYPFCVRTFDYRKSERPSVWLPVKCAEKMYETISLADPRKPTLDGELTTEFGGYSFNRIPDHFFSLYDMSRLGALRLRDNRAGPSKGAWYSLPAHQNLTDPKAAPNVEGLPGDLAEEWLKAVAAAH